MSTSFKELLISHTIEEYFKHLEECYWINDQMTCNVQFVKL